MKSVQQHAATAARLTLGGGFLVFGLNGFLQFLPQPPVAESGGAFLGALAASGYMFPLIKGTEVVAGALLVANRFAPLALTLLAPVLVNILAFHVFLSPAGLALPLALLAAELYAAWSYRDALAPMLRRRVEPRATEASGHSGAEPARA